jgi:Family of unknown function (DUF5683)
MAIKFTFLLMSWLLCSQLTTALAVTPQQGRTHNHTPVQSGREALRATFNATSKIAAQEDAVKKHRYVAEEMVMQRAWIYSAILPGWGQVCNAHYWKVPVIYAGFSGFLGGAIYYHKEYFQAKKELMQEKRTSRGSLENYVNDCRANRDLYFILATLWYVINIFDAYVGASLKTFTLSDDISARIEPTTLLTPCNLPTVGLSLTLSFQNENTPDRLRKDGAGY